MKFGRATVLSLTTYNLQKRFYCGLLTPSVYDGEPTFLSKTRKRNVCSPFSRMADNTLLPAKRPAVQEEERQGPLRNNPGEEAQEEKIPPAWKRKNTPGNNSYLKVLFSNAVLDSVFQLTQETKRDFETLQREEESLSSTGEQSRDRRQSRGLSIRLRSRRSLHMTLFFGGEVLCELPDRELVDWHSALTARFLEAGLTLAHSGAKADGMTVATDDYWFRFRELAVFPPRRNNLIVAIFEVSPAWEKLHNDIRQISRSIESEGLLEITKRGKTKWTAHVTVANLKGKTEDVKKLTQFLQEKFFVDHGANSRHTTLNQDRVQASGVSMGGPIPPQVELEWDFFPL